MEMRAFLLKRMVSALLAGLVNLANTIPAMQAQANTVLERAREYNTPHTHIMKMDYPIPILMQYLFQLKGVGVQHRISETFLKCVKWPNQSRNAVALFDPKKGRKNFLEIGCMYFFKPLPLNLYVFCLLMQLPIIVVTTRCGVQ